jgi:hypothetical protein
MAGVKISALPGVAAALLTDFFPVVQAGVTSQETLAQVSTLFQTIMVPLAGGTMTGALILNTSTPTTSLQAASKGYVDTIAQGITVQQSCQEGTTVNLTAAYFNGVSGVGATLTNSGAQAALVIDGITVALNDRILVKNQSTTFQNGIYTVTNQGSGATNWVLTRATDYNLAAQINQGDLIVIDTGTVNAASGWLQTAVVTSIGTDPILFSLFNASLPISVANGGTGATTVNGALIALSAIGKINVIVFPATGTYTRTANCLYAKFETVGGGAAGGGAAAAGAGAGTGGGGGGGGGYSMGVFSAATIGATQTVTIGAGGTAGTAGANAGNNGGDTSIGTLCIAKGGTGGSGSNTAPGGAGGAAGISGTGTVTIPGGKGGQGVYAGVVSCIPIGGYGGNSILGFGASLFANNGVGTGSPGTGFGAGGSGGVTYNNTGTISGVVGTGGYAIITEYIAST